MNIFATIVPAFKMKGVNFYSVHFDGRDEMEFDDFVEYFETVQGPDREAFDELIAFIKEVGLDEANEHYFRHEGPANASALPVKWTDDEGAYLVSPSNPIRLYCVRVNRQIVVLCNGGIKTVWNPEECNNVKRYFREVRRIARELDKLLRDKDLFLDGFYLRHVDGGRIRIQI